MRKNIIKIIFLITSLIILSNASCAFFTKLNEQIKVNGYYENNTSERYKDNSVLKIDKLNLENLVSKADKNYENLDDGLVYYDTLEPKDKIIIFGHSGMGKGTYFNRLEELENSDVFYLYVKDMVCTYKVSKMYLVSETDLSILIQEENSGKLLLVTCDKKNKSKRLVVEARLESSKILKK